MNIDWTFIGFFTNPYFALVLFLDAMCVMHMIYGNMSTQTSRKYSRFQEWYYQSGNKIVFEIGSLILTVATILTLIVVLDGGIKEGVGMGVIAYILLIPYAFVLFSKANNSEKRDIQGLHKQKISALKDLIGQHMEELEEYQYDGKTKIQLDAIHTQWKELLIHIQNEKKIRKNKENIYRSLRRLDELEGKRRENLASFKFVRAELQKIYDKITLLETKLLEERFENQKKLLDVAKETMKKDPFATKIILEKIEKTTP